MSKNAHFSGQPIFSQLLNLLDKQKIEQSARTHNGDRYYKKFKTYDHLVAMLYAIFHKCTSLREIETGMQVCYHKLNHLGVIYAPRRSTLSDANAKRSSQIFEKIYQQLYEMYSSNLPDSPNGSRWISKLYIADSTTISLFKEILKTVGTPSKNGRKKGGIKVHTLIKADQDVPCLIRMTAAAKHDVPFIKKLKLPKGSIITFDKGYVDYAQYNLWDQEGITWVTRMRKGAKYEVVSDNVLTERQKTLGVKQDQKIILGHTSHNMITRTSARLIEFYDKESDRTFRFITNSNKYAAQTIAEIYKRRWQIEVLFKRLKQNYPLQYFLGDNENAIRIQIWCTLIADLLLKVVLSKLKRKWSFSNLSSMVRIHLMSYVHLLKFLNNPEKLLLNAEIEHVKNPSLFSP